MIIELINYCEKDNQFEENKDKLVQYLKIEE